MAVFGGLSLLLRHRDDVFSTGEHVSIFFPSRTSVSMMLAACGVDSERDVKARRKLTFDEKRQDRNYFFYPAYLWGPTLMPGICTLQVIYVVFSHLHASNQLLVVANIDRSRLFCLKKASQHFPCRSTLCPFSVCCRAA